MKIKGLVIAVGLLVVLSLVAYVANRPATPASNDPRVGKSVADADAIEKAAKLKLSSEGKTVLLTRQADGSWVVNSYYDLPADFAKLSGFVGDLAKAKIQRLVTASSDKIARLEFKDTQISLLDSADKPLWSVTLGKNFPSGGRFLRYGDESKAYLADLNAWIDTEPRSWANSALLPVKSDDVAKIEISLPEGDPFIVARPKKEDPFVAENPPAGQKLKTDKITSLLGSLTNLRFTDTSAPDDEKAVAAKAHTRTVKFTTFDGKTIIVSLGRKPEEKIVKPAPTPPPVVEASKTIEAEKSGTLSDVSTKPTEPITETIPAGPVYGFVTHSDTSAPVNTFMRKRAFQVSEYTFTDLPKNRGELLEPVPPAPATPALTASQSFEPTKASPPKASSSTRTPENAAKP